MLQRASRLPSTADGHAIDRGDTVRTATGHRGSFYTVVCHDTVLVDGQEPTAAAYGLPCGRWLSRPRSAT
jgi:hypothetical protein